MLTRRCIPLAGSYWMQVVRKHLRRCICWLKLHSPCGELLNASYGLPGNSRSLKEARCIPLAGSYWMQGKTKKQQAKKQQCCIPLAGSYWMQASGFSCYGLDITIYVAFPLRGVIECKTSASVALGEQSCIPLAGSYWMQGELKSPSNSMMMESLLHSPCGELLNASEIWRKVWYWNAGCIPLAGSYWMQGDPRGEWPGQRKTLHSPCGELLNASASWRWVAST